MTRRSMVVLPSEAADKIRAAGSVWGNLKMARHAADDMYVVTNYQAGSTGARLPVRPAAGQDRLRQPQPTQHLASWHRASLEAQVLHWQLSTRPTKCIPLDDFMRLVQTVKHPRNHMSLVITHAPQVPDLDDAGPLREFAAWAVTTEGAAPYDLEVEPATYGLTQLTGHWPVETLGERAVLIVGVGSIGGVVATQLAAYGVGTLHLLDPDRLLWHNVVRHVLGDGEVGRFKVEALADTLRARWPGLNALPHVNNVVSDADHVRTLLTKVDAVVCAADGIAPRRVVSHLARRAGRDAILTSVLEDGAIGEVLRLRRAPDHGCLLCRREVLYDAGRMDPEQVQERGYGDGDPHRPMTAVAPDLALVGTLAAKVAVASLLDRAGHADQRLPGEQAIIALRPRPDFEPPFNLGRAGQVAWHPATPPRPDCFTCGPP